MTTLYELLEVPRFSDLRVLSNQADLSHKVESIEISETPDIAYYIPKNVFLLTTAMIYKDNQSDLIPLIDSLKSAHAAGLGIKVGRFLGEIDKKVLDYAARVNFPLVQLPNTKQLGAISHQMTSYLWNQKTEQFTFALDIQKRFSSLLINDVSVERLISEFGKLVKTPVMLLDPFHEVTAVSAHFNHTVNLADFYLEQVIPQLAFLKEDETHSFIIDNLQGKKIQAAIFPVKANHHFPYRLLVLQPEQIPYPISEFTIEQAILVLSFILFKNQKVEESLEELKTDFFAQLIENQQSMTFQNKNWLEIGRSFGLIPSHYYQVIYVNERKNGDHSPQDRYRLEKRQLAFQWLSKKLPDRISNTLVFQLKESPHLVILLQTPHEELDTVLTSVAEELEELLPVSLAFSYSQPYEKDDMIANSFIESRLAFEEATSLEEQQPRIHFSHRHGIVKLFKHNPIEETQYFCKSVLKELAYPEKESLIELRKTLKAFLDYQCEITKTADMLFVHRNTVKYRINRCKKIIGRPIEDPEVSLQLRLAFALSEPDKHTDYMN